VLHTRLNNFPLGMQGQGAMMGLSQQRNAKSHRIMFDL
jgi:hypothetical protein